MEKPKARYVEVFPVKHEGRDMIVLRDAEGITDNSLLMAKSMLYIISLMDGTRTLRDIQADYMRASQQLLYIEQIQEIVDIMDNNLFLLNERYVNHVRQVKEEYDRAGTRKPCLAGKSYPSGSFDLARMLDEMLKDDGVTDIRDIRGDITGILAPHIDYNRGGAVYRDTYRYIRALQKPLLVIFGTCHRMTDKIWSISLKDFETPFDKIPVSEELRGRIRNHSLLGRYIDEWPHRNEHSIELQLPVIQFLVPDLAMEILPILTGSMEEFIAGERPVSDGEPADLAGALKEVLDGYGKEYIVISGADLAHIGAQFGDPHPLDAYVLGRSEIKDRALLDAIGRVNAEEFFNAVKEENDSRRICGLAPIYFQLKMLEGNSCEVVSYDQWTDGDSSVSFAGACFYSPII